MAETLTRASMQITDKPDSTCVPGGIKEALQAVAKQLVNPDSSAAVCDPLFRKSLHAELVERTSTIFVPFKSSAALGAPGGNLILTPTLFNGQLVPLEWFKNGIQYPKAAQDPLATSIAPTVGQLLPGEACPWALTFADTDAITQSTPPSNSFDFDADLVTEENQDFAAFGLSFEYAGTWTVEQGAGGVGTTRRVQQLFPYQGSGSYEERILKAIYQNISLRMQFVEGGDTRLYRLGSPISWPSYTGYFGKGAMTNGQPAMFMFKDLFFGLQMNKRPRLTGNSRVRLFADLPSQLNVQNNPAVPVPADLSHIGNNQDLDGYVWVALRARLFGSAMCIDQSTGQSTEVASANLQSVIDRAVREALAKSGR